MGSVVHHLLLIALLASLAYVEVDGQAAGQIVRLTEEVVGSAGGGAVLNCTVSSPDPSIRELVFVEWAFLNATGGAKTLTKDCGIIEEHNIISGREKYAIGCHDYQTINTLYSLTVDMLSFPDNGLYECRVRLSNEQLPVSTMRVTLTVRSPPKIQMSATPLSTDAFLNDTVSIPCTAEGIPGPNVTWSRANGKPLHPKRTQQVRRYDSSTITTQTLSITNITKGDSGSYRCIADNFIRPPDEFLVRLAVQYKPTVRSVEPNYGSPTGEHTQVMIWCRVEGNPRPDVSWYAMTTKDRESYDKGDLELNAEFFSNAKKIVSDEKYGVEQKLLNVGRLSTIDSMFISLSLYTVEPGDMTHYVCQAKNTFGDDSAVVNLYRINTLAGLTSNAAYNTISMFMSMLLAASLCLVN